MIRSDAERLFAHIPNVEIMILYTLSPVTHCIACLEQLITGICMYGLGMEAEALPCTFSVDEDIGLSLLNNTTANGDGDESAQSHHSRMACH